MDDTATPEPPPQPLPDSWDAQGKVPLDGALERANLHPAVPALFWPILAVVLFFFVSQVAIAIMLGMAGVDLQLLAEDVTVLLEDHTDVLIIANTIGQVLALALPVVALTMLHSSRPSAFLRLRAPDWELMGLAFLGWIALIPLVSFLGEVNQVLPLPEVFRLMEEQQMELIEQVLFGDLGFIFTLSMLAITPAICEELLFRGYTQRQAERGFGVVGGILFSGIVFGLYHLRLTQVLPLAALGVYLAYLAWRTGNLWVPIVIHFVNNAYAVALGMYARETDVDWSSLEQMAMPWYLVVIGGVLLVGVIVVLDQRARRRLTLARGPEV